jgi:hypothetical protein
LLENFMKAQSWIRNVFARPVTRPIRKPPHRGTRLVLEALEDRTVPSTFTVTNTNDSGAGSLRDAIAQAQSGANLGSPTPSSSTTARCPAPTSTTPRRTRLP